MGLRRTSGNRVVHVHHLVQGLDRLVEDRNLEFTFWQHGHRLRQHTAGVVDTGVVQVGCSQRGFPGGQVGERRDAAFVGARTKGHQHLGLLPQQPGHLFVLGIADRAVEEAEVNVAVRIVAHIGVLEICRHRPEDDVKDRVDVQNMIADVEDGDLAATAGGCPVHAKFGFA